MKLLFTSLFLAVLAHAKVVVVSDIDDTIKVSHVLDSSDSVSNAARMDNLFYGMPELYQSIQSSTNAKMFYLSNAPRALMERYHRNFLSKNKFPNGGLLLRENIFDKTFKLRMIRKIIRDEVPSLLILIGDNGEHDSEVYYQITQEYPSLQIMTYIRQVYSAFYGTDLGAEIYANQTGFVTPIEVAISLQKKSLLSSQNVINLERFYVPFALSQTFELTKGVLAFPGWQDCRDFLVPESLLKRQTQLGQQLAFHILKRCSVPGVDTDKD